MACVCVLSWASPSLPEQRKCLQCGPAGNSGCKPSVWLQGPWLKAGMTVDSVKLNQLEQSMPPGPWKAASIHQKRLALHQTMSPLLTRGALINICKRNKVENSTCVGGGRAWDRSTTPVAFSSQYGSGRCTKV